jgi:hypothetical protein
VILEGQILTVKGTMSNGKSVLFTNGKTKTPKRITHRCYGKGIVFEKKQLKQGLYPKVKALGFTAERPGV